MRFLLVNFDYSDFLDWFYGRHPGLAEQPFEEQYRARMASLHNVTTFYPRHLEALGHEAWHVWVNNEPLQRAWARQHGVKLTPRRRLHFRMRRHLVPWVSYERTERWRDEVLRAQIEHYKPEVLMCFYIVLSREFLLEVKPHLRWLVGQHAAPVPRGVDFTVYDLMISSLPNLVSHFRSLGVRSELVKWAFEPAALDSIGQPEQTIAVSFIGSLQPAHAGRREWLEYLCERLPLDVWGPNLEGLPPDSPVRPRYRGQAWAEEMYGLLARSRISLNHHIDVAGNHANNLRLFEATGMGSLLVTDHKSDLHQMFEPGTEVVTFKDAPECVERVRYYLEHEDERAAIARAGQQRTLRDHRLKDRIAELVRAIESL